MQNHAEIDKESFLLGKIFNIVIINYRKTCMPLFYIVVKKAILRIDKAAVLVGEAATIF